MPPGKAVYSFVVKSYLKNLYILFPFGSNCYSVLHILALLNFSIQRGDRRNVGRWPWGFRSSSRPPPTHHSVHSHIKKKRNMVFASITDFTHLTENLFSRGNTAVKVRNEWKLPYSLRMSTGWYLPTAKWHCNKDIMHIVTDLGEAKKQRIL